MGVRPTPPVQRALKVTVEKLRAQGHDVIDWEPELHRDLIELLVSWCIPIRLGRRLD